MKGNQGLDLLAAMSGDAAKADEGRPVAAAPAQAAPVAAAASPAASAIAAPAPPAAQPSWPAPTGGPPGVDALAAALAQQGGAGNLIQAAAGLILRQQQAQQQQAQQQQQQQQQLAQIQLIQQAQAQAAAAQAAQAAAAANPTALALAMAAAQQQQQQQAAKLAQSQQQAPPTPNAPITIAAAPAAKDTSASTAAEMAVAAAAHQHQHQHQQHHPATVSLAGTSTADSLTTTIEEKKVMKRAANRRSAQLSRKRKKQFIEDLREENAILRRKEQILRSIPDLVVVFDSAGRLLFVSESVGRLLSFKSDELDGSSFWDRLCDESVKLLKAAFMDALAARNSDVGSVASSNSSKSKAGKKGKAKASKDDDMEVEPDSVPLGSGMWELRLVDKDGSHHLVTLTGVVHFPSDESGHSTPECVCSIRPRENAQNLRSSFSAAGQGDRKRARNGSSNVVDPSSSSSTSSDDGNDGASNAPSTTSEGGGSSTTESDSHFPPNLVRDSIKPQQSVISNASCGSTSALSSDGDGTSKSISGTKRPANDNDESIISDGSSVRVSG